MFRNRYRLVVAQKAVVNSVKEEKKSDIIWEVISGPNCAYDARTGRVVCALVLLTVTL